MGRIGIPLRADPTALAKMERRSFHRAAAAMAMTVTRGGTSTGRQPEEVLRENWRDDDDAERILRAASSPLTTSNFAAIQSTKFVEMLAPDCAASKLLNLGYKFDLSGISSIKLPYVGGAGRPAKPAFIAEGQPAPAPNLATSAAVLGPTCKVLIQSAITGELQSASAETAEGIVGQALAISTAQSLDAALFSANPAVPGVSPQGILFGIPPLLSGGAIGLGGCAADLGNLAGAIGAAGVSIDDMVIITTPSLATKVRIYAGPHYDDKVFSSAYIQSGQVIGVVPQGLASGYQGQVSLETSLAAALAMDDTAPPQIGTPGSPNVVAAPTLSAFQAYLIVVKVRARMAWTVQPSCVALVTGASW
jgi:hypothetical protein